MKLHQSTKTIRVRILDGKTVIRTIYQFKGVKISVEKNHLSTNKATHALKNYLTNPKKK